MRSKLTLKHCIPIIFLLILLSLLGWELFFAQPRDLPSALIGDDVPNFALPTIHAPDKLMTPNDFKGHVILLNVWATWCSACQMELPMLMKIKSQYHVSIYGIDYKDQPADAVKWLKENGNPYVMVGSDSSGNAAIDLGVYGTPETFVISPYGKIIYRHIGVIDENTWKETIYPMVKKYEK